MGQVLRNPRNAGLMQWRGQLTGVKAAWDPIISYEDWRSVRAVLDDARRRASVGRPHVGCAQKPHGANAEVH
ncbi:hypothetical protein [Pseudonocardia sp. ICBG601]|uniref:hypothetical protein n=1 Tax=Pseudonocardia sp. ICBG601 TaxID=2846759 RepID=UPI0035ABB9AB